MIKMNFECKRGSLTIRGTEYRPEGNDLPVAIVSHGFMANQGTVRHYAKVLAAMGYAAYCFDFCGGCVVGGKSDGKTTEMSVLTEVADLMTVIGYATSRPYVRKDKLVLMGCSQGGFVSALTAARLKDRVTELILFYPALCIPDDARKGRMMFARFDPAAIPDVFWCGPMKLGRCYPADVMAMNPFQEIAPYSGRTLIVHGTKDGIVDVSNAQRAQMAYLAERTDPTSVQLRIIDGGGHGFSRKHDAQAIGCIGKFLQN